MNIYSHTKYIMHEPMLMAAFWGKKGFGPVNEWENKDSYSF